MGAVEGSSSQTRSRVCLGTLLAVRITSIRPARSAGVEAAPFAPLDPLRIATCPDLAVGPPSSTEGRYNSGKLAHVIHGYPCSASGSRACAEQIAAGIRCALTNASRSASNPARDRLLATCFTSGHNPRVGGVVHAGRLRGRTGRQEGRPCPQRAPTQLRWHL